MTVASGNPLYPTPGKEDYSLPIAYSNSSIANLQCYIPLSTLFHCRPWEVICATDSDQLHSGRTTRAVYEKVERTSFPSQSALGHFTQWERLWTEGRLLSLRHAAGQGTQQTLWALSFSSSVVHPYTSVNLDGN